MPKDNHCPASDGGAGPDGSLNDDLGSSVDRTLCSHRARSEQGVVQGRSNANSPRSASCGSRIIADGQTNGLGADDCPGNSLRAMTGHYSNSGSHWSGWGAKDIDGGSATWKVDMGDNLTVSHGADTCDGTDSADRDILPGEDTHVNNICEGVIPNDKDICDGTYPHGESDTMYETSPQEDNCNRTESYGNNDLCDMDKDTCPGMTGAGGRDKLWCETRLDDTGVCSRENCGSMEECSHAEERCEEFESHDLCGKTLDEKVTDVVINTSDSAEIMIYCVSCRTQREKQYCYYRGNHGYFGDGTSMRASECNLRCVWFYASLCDVINDSKGFLGEYCRWWGDIQPTKKHGLLVTVDTHTDTWDTSFLANHDRTDHEGSGHNESSDKGGILRYENTVLSCCYGHHRGSDVIWAPGCHHISWLGCNGCHGDPSGAGNLPGLVHVATRANTGDCANCGIYTTPINDGGLGAGNGHTQGPSDNECNGNAKSKPNSTERSTGISYDKQGHHVSHDESCDDEGHVPATNHQYAQNVFSVEKQISVQCNLMAFDVPRHLYIDCYRDMNVSQCIIESMDLGEWFSKFMDAFREFPMRHCNHNSNHQETQRNICQNDCLGTSCHDATSSSVICVGLPTKSDFTSDSAYCSLERHANAVEYLILRGIQEYDKGTNNGPGSSDGEMVEDSGTEECSSDTEDTLIIDAETYTRDKRKCF